MPSAPNSRAFAASSGVSALARTRIRRRSSAQPRIVSKFSSIDGGNERHGSDDHASRAAVDRDDVTRAQVVLADAERPRRHVDRQLLAARDTRLAHAPRDDGRVRGHPAVGGEHPGRVDEPVDVVGSRLPAHEDDALARLAALLGGVRVEHDRARCRTRGRIQPTRGHLDRCIGIDHRVQELVELARIDARDRLLARDEPLVDHLRRDA